VAVQAIRPPRAWAEAQQAFRLAYRRRSTMLRRQPARIRWWTNRDAVPPERFTALAATSFGQLRRWRSAPGSGQDAGRGQGQGRARTEGTYVAVYAPSAAPGARPVVCFAARNGSFTEPAGSSDAMVVGEIGLNAVCCIELPDGSTIWPSHNPTVPLGRFPGAP